MQVEELVVKFSEVQVQGTVSNPATGNQGSSSTSGTQAATPGGSFEFEAFRLQVEEVTLTAPGNASQPVPAQTPSQTASASESGQPAATSSTAAA